MTLASPTTVLLGLFALTSCGHLIGPSHGLTGGERRVVVEDSTIQDILGTSLAKLAPQEHFAGRWGAVLPVGASIEVSEDYVQRRELMAPGATMLDRNPWVHVRVIDSPVPAQVGWSGWVHVGTLQPSSAAPLTTLGAPLLARPSLLCPGSDDASFACRVQVDSQQPMRIRGCATGRAWVELWSARGFYITGTIERRQFRVDPCEQRQRS